jgi:hypothetical protein
MKYCIDEKFSMDRATELLEAPPGVLSADYRKKLERFVKHASKDPPLCLQVSLSQHKHPGRLPFPLLCLQVSPSQHKHPGRLPFPSLVLAGVPQSTQAPQASSLPCWC